MADEIKKDPSTPPDLSKILLPKKEGTPSLDSAQRVNAAILLEQEQQATLVKPAPDIKPPAPVAPPEPKKEESGVRAVQTYRGAIEQAIQQKNTSVVSIAAAEAQRRAQRSATPAPAEASSTESAPAHDWGFTLAAVLGGAILILGSTALLLFIFWKPQADAPVATAPSSPFIQVDDTRLVSIAPQQWQRAPVMNALATERESTALSLGLMARLYVAQATTTGRTPPSVSVQSLLGVIAPNVSGELLRSLTGEYLLGVHSFDDNQAFLILGVEGYEAAYAGMLDWELAMPGELSPLFSRTPRPRIPEENIQPVQTTPILPFQATQATSTASSTPFVPGPTSSSTNATSTATSTTPGPTVPDFFRTQFVDRIVENHDARVVQDTNGDILLLWTFLDRQTLVITTNEYTLREIISRRSRPPVITL